MKALLKILFFASGIIFSQLKFNDCIAQKQDNIWYFAYDAGLNFNSGAPVALPNANLRTEEGSSSICDKNTGQLLFYTDGINVWDTSQNNMPHGNSLMGNPSSTQSALIIPMPGNTTKYYIFTADAQAGATYPGPSYKGYGGIAYNVVDMTLNGGLGDVSIKNQHLLTPADEKLAAITNCNGHDIWVLTHQWNTNAFYAYLVTDNGILAPVITNSGAVHKDVGSGQSPVSKNAEAIGYMKFSPDGKKLALACYFDLNIVQVFDFDNCTGIVCNPITDTDFPVNGENGPYGVSFSPDNSRLYVSYLGFNGDSSILYQYNMLAESGSSIIASRTKVGRRLGTACTALQIGPDGKIYVAVDQGNSNLGYNYLDVINNPNGLGKACNYTADALYLNVGGHNQGVFGLPSFMENNTGPPATPYEATLAYPTCSTADTLSFVDTLSGNITASWNFGDPVSGVNNISSLQNTNHDFIGGNNYTVKLILTGTCSIDTFSKTINAADTFSISAGQDVSICNGRSTLLNASGGNPLTYVWAPATGLNCTTCAHPIANPLLTTQYILTDSGKCNSASDTVVISVNPSPHAGSISSQEDTICAGSIAHLNLNGNSGIPQWQHSSSVLGGFSFIPGATSEIYSSSLSQTTYYRSIIDSGACRDTSSVFTETAVPFPIAAFSASVSGFQVSFNSNSSKNADFYSWDFDDNVTSTEANPTHTYDSSGIFHVCLSERNISNCYFTLCQNVYVSADGVNDINAGNSFSVYPNPAGANITVTVNNMRHNISCTLIDITGRKIKSSKLTNGINYITIDELATGVYLLEIGDEYKQTFKLVKE